MLNKRSLPPEPSRSAKRTSRGNLRWLLVGAILFPLAGVFEAWQYGPLLFRDLSLGEDLRPVDRAHVDGRCRSKLVLYSCEIKAIGRAPQEMELNYMFADWPFEHHTARLLEKISNPAMLTTDLGQKNLLNRAATLLAMLLFCFAVPIAYLRARRRSKLDPQNAYSNRLRS
jgi:hypothetical protein